MDLSEDLLDEYIETGEEVEAENEQLLTVFLNGEEQEEEEKTIIQAKDLTSDFFLNLHTKSFICLEPAPSSKSTFWKDLINFFPPLTDVGIDKAIYLEPLEIVEDDIGVEIYVKSCKKLEIYPMTRIINSLPTKILNLKYYYLDLKQMRALTDALLINKQVKELIFQDSFLTPEQVQLISEILELNHNITILNLRGCKIGPEGAEQLAPGLDITLSLKDLDLSFNYIKDEGFKHIHESIRTNNSIVNLNLSHNELAEDSAPLFAELFKNNMSIQNLDLSWNFFFNGPGNINLNRIKDKRPRTVNLLNQLILSK